MRKNVSQGWRLIGGGRVYFRSKWEYQYALYLEYLKKNGHIKDWFHEPYTFWFEGIRRGCVTYLPDFKVIDLDNSHYWVEVKGYMDAKSKTKIKRFHKYYPKEKLIIIDGKWFKKNRAKMLGIIPNWDEKTKLVSETICQMIKSSDPDVRAVGKALASACY